MSTATDQGVRSEPGTVDQFRERATAWLAERLPRKLGWAGPAWGQGSDAVPVFNNVTHAEGEQMMRVGAAWQRQKYEAGYGAIALPVELGGRGLHVDYELAFLEVEHGFQTPTWDELLEVTIDLVAPTVAAHGSPALCEKYLVPLLTADLLCTQLFSEPGAGSDLASLTCSAVRDGDNWIVNGQKVWNSGAQYAHLGMLIARTDPTVAKHKGLSAFLFPLDTAGVQVRPIRQMNGGRSFNEVFLDGAVISDEYRLGEPGDGWQVALTTLRFEREHAAMTGGFNISELFGKVAALAAHTGRDSDPVIAAGLAELYAPVRMVQLIAIRVQESMTAGQVPGPEGSIGKLLWSQALTQISDLVTEILGEDVIADSGAWGSYAWSQHILGAPGFRIAGGSDEIQRTIIAERVLGLPKEPKV